MSKNRQSAAVRISKLFDGESVGQSCFVNVFINGGGPGGPGAELRLTYRLRASDSFKQHKIPKNKKIASIPFGGQPAMGEGGGTQVMWRFEPLSFSSRAEPTSDTPMRGSAEWRFRFRTNFVLKFSTPNCSCSSFERGWGPWGPRKLVLFVLLAAVNCLNN